MLFAGFGALVLTLDGPLRWAGRVVQAARNRLKRKAEPMTGLPDRLVYERNRIRDVLGRRWKAALLLSSGRLAFDFGTLLADPGHRGQARPVARAAGLRGGRAARADPHHARGARHRGGRVERAAHPGRACRGATPSSPRLAYRIISYWLPIVVGPFAYFAFRLRYGKPGQGDGAAGAGGPALAAG